MEQVARPATLGCLCCGGWVGARPQGFLSKVSSGLAGAQWKRVAVIPKNRATFSSFFRVSWSSFCKVAKAPPKSPLKTPPTIAPPRSPPKCAPQQVPRESGSKVHFLTFRRLARRTGANRARRHLSTGLAQLGPAAEGRRPIPFFFYKSYS